MTYGNETTVNYIYDDQGRTSEVVYNNTTKNHAYTFDGNPNIKAVTVDGKTIAHAKTGNPLSDGTWGYT